MSEALALNHESSRPRASSEVRTNPSLFAVSPSPCRVPVVDQGTNRRPDKRGSVERNGKKAAMKVPSVSKEVWQERYGAARDFRNVECWDWLSDSDIFGVLNPVSGEVGYCCVLGELGKVFGLVVYLGTDGLNQYKAIQSGEVGPDGDDAVFFQNCLKVSFEDRNELSKDDLEVIRGLGLKFRGRNSWPQFRSFRPGYFPWYLTEAEGKYLTLGLRQATVVALCFGRDPRMLTGPTKTHYLVRVPVKSGVEWEWTSQWLEPPPAAKTQPHVEPPDELRLRRIRKKIIFFLSSL